MLVDFENLPEDSRIWIYQANRKLSGEEVEMINEKAKAFLVNWTAHGADRDSR